MSNPSPTGFNHKISLLVRSNFPYFLPYGILLLPSFLTSIRAQPFLYVGSQVAAWLGQSIILVKLVAEAMDRPTGVRSWFVKGICCAPKLAWTGFKIFGLQLVGWIVFSILGFLFGRQLGLGHIRGMPVTIVVALLLPSLFIGTRCAFALPLALSDPAPYSKQPIRASFRLTRRYWLPICSLALGLFVLTWPIFFAFSHARKQPVGWSVLSILLWPTAYWIFMSVAVLLCADAVANTPAVPLTDRKMSPITRVFGGLGLMAVIALILWASIARGRISRSLALTRTVVHAVRETVALQKKGLLRVQPGEIVENYPGNHVKNRYATSGQSKGTSVDYYENGQKKSETIMEHGQRIAWRAWFQDGQLEGETLFREGQPTLTKYWYPSGKIHSTDEFSAIGKRKTTMFYQDGHKQSEMTMKDDRPIGQITNWYPTGQISYQNTLSEDGSHSHLVQYYPDGKKRGEENYYLSKKDGEQTYWDPSGKAIKVHYKDGVKLPG